MASGGPQSASEPGQSFKQQQQELVKLLTQHFHFQFYRMAANSQASQPEQLATTYHQPASLLQSPTAYGRAAYSLGAPAGLQLVTNGFDLSPQLNSSPPGQQTQQKLSNTQQLVSARQQSTPSNNHRQNTGATNKALCESPMLIMDQTRACSLSEINLFNALGLSNLTNNQLVLSLQQQQSILQASAAAAAAASAIPQGFKLGPQDAYCDFNDSTDHSPFWKPCKLTDKVVENRIKTEESLENLSRQQQQQHQSMGEKLDASKQMLKFSINTILGNGLTRSLNTEPPRQSQPCAETLHKPYDQLEPVSHPFMVSINETTSTANKELRNQQIEMRTTDYDHNQSDSDDCGGSPNQSPTPEPSSSILFTNDQPDHPSANTQHINGLIADHQQQGRIHNQNPLQHPFLNGSSVFPWAVASRGKPRRGMMRRAVFSDGQRVGLEKRFQFQKYINKPDRKKLAEKLGLRDSQVKIWFQNRRMKWRNSKERELLSAGGSREQTLPNRSNPNPDLSDVGETIKRLTNSSGKNVET